MDHLNTAAIPSPFRCTPGPDLFRTLLIKLGHTNPWSGPASSDSTIGKCIIAYWTMVNDKVGINDRKIDFISLDDGYSPTNTAIHKYLNRKVRMT